MAVDKLQSGVKKKQKNKQSSFFIYIYLVPSTSHDTSEDSHL